MVSVTTDALITLHDNKFNVGITETFINYIRQRTHLLSYRLPFSELYPMSFSNETRLRL